MSKMTGEEQTEFDPGLPNQDDGAKRMARQDDNAAFIAASRNSIAGYESALEMDAVRRDDERRGKAPAAEAAAPCPMCTGSGLVGMPCTVCGEQAPGGD